MKKFIRKIFIFEFLLIFIFNVIIARAEINDISNKNSPGNTDIVVVVKEDGIWAVDIINPSVSLLLKGGKNYEYPIISNDGYVAFKNNVNELNITKIDFKNKIDSFKVDDNVSTYNWTEEDKLIYSKFDGGIYLLNPKDKSIEILKAGKEFYSQIIIGKDNSIFAVGNIIRENSSDNYPTPIGIINFNISSKKEEIILPYIPVNAVSGDLGLNPKIAAISKDGTNLFIWLRPNSASTTADGVKLGVINTINNEFKEIANEDIILLTYKDNLDVSPIDNNLIALINGNSRFMNTNKTLGVLDIRDENFRKISKYDEVAMTPSYSIDGNKIIYSASKANEDMHKWESSFHQHIYEIDLKDNRITKLTSSIKGFDFLPKYINGNEFIFIRKDMENNFSLIKVRENGIEQIIIQDIISQNDKVLYEDLWYYGHYNINKIFAYKKVNLSP